jgi:hypothetical protein
MRRGAWIAGALVAGAALVAVALHGERPGAGFSRYEPQGVMLQLSPDRATAVEVLRDGVRWRFVRVGSGRWTTAEGSPRVAGDPTEQVELGLRFLHGSAPQRRMEREEVAGMPLAELGLAPPRITVTVFAADQAPFAVEAGSPNPQGYARYARVAGEVLLLNRYVVEQWEKLITP